MPTTRTTKTAPADETPAGPTPEELEEFRAYQAQKAAVPETPADTSEPEKRVWFTLDGNFVWPNTPEGDIKIRLRFKTKLLRAIRGKDMDELDQLIELLDGIGDKKTIAQLDELDFLEETMPIVSGFFEAFREKNEASLGESKRS